MKGPTICRFPCGSARRTSNPSPRSRVRGTMTSSSASQEAGSPRIGSLEGCQLMDFSLTYWPISIAEKLSICPAGKSLVFGFDAPLLVALTRSDLQALGLGALVLDLEITRHRLS